MNSVRDYRNNPNPISFSEFKRLINGIDEKSYGSSWVYVGEDNRCAVVGFSILPPGVPGASTVQFYGLSDGVPPAIHIHLTKAGR